MEVFGSESLDHKVERNKNDQKKTSYLVGGFNPFEK